MKDTNILIIFVKSFHVLSQDHGEMREDASREIIAQGDDTKNSIYNISEPF